jgi:hypothetical protein
MSESDPSPTLPLRNPGHAHALRDTLAFGEVGWIIALCVEAEATNGKAWVERKSGFSGGPRLFLRAEQQRGEVLSSAKWR